MPCGAYSSTPSPAELIPSPYKQGESAVRSDFLTQRRKDCVLLVKIVRHNG